MSMAACMPSRAPRDWRQPAAGGLITFRNQMAMPIQVYLVGEKSECLLGRLEPFETARLRLRASSCDGMSASVILVVVPGWSRTFDARHHPAGVQSLKEPSERMSGETWAFVNGQIMGPWR
jgi:hypothetical protein